MRLYVQLYEYIIMGKSLRVLYEQFTPNTSNPFKHFKLSEHSVHSKHSKRVKRVKHFEYVGAFPSLKEIDLNALQCMRR